VWLEVKAVIVQNTGNALLSLTHYTEITLKCPFSVARNIGKCGKEIQRFFKKVTWVSN
jgi:hypothetical protein